MAEMAQHDGVAIEVRGLTKAYGDVHAVRGIDLLVERGKIFALLGPNGAGKTTIVEILEGYRSRDGGDAACSRLGPRTGSQVVEAPRSALCAVEQYRALPLRLRGDRDVWPVLPDSTTGR